MFARVEEYVDAIELIHLRRSIDALKCGGDGIGSVHDLHAQHEPDLIECVNQLEDLRRAGSVGPSELEAAICPRLVGHQWCRVRCTNDRCVVVESDASEAPFE